MSAAEDQQPSEVCKEEPDGGVAGLVSPTFFKRLRLPPLRLLMFDKKAASRRNGIKTIRCAMKSHQTMEDRRFSYWPQVVVLGRWKMVRLGNSDLENCIGLLLNDI